MGEVDRTQTDDWILIPSDMLRIHCQTHNLTDALVNKLKEAGVGRGGMWPKGEVFSFYVAYGGT